MILFVIAAMPHLSLQCCEIYADRDISIHYLGGNLQERGVNIPLCYLGNRDIITKQLFL